MILFPPCKINLGLHVLCKRDDGYHAIETCMYPVPIYDILEIIPSKEFEFTSSGIPIPGEASSNLCVKAFQILQEKFSLPNVKIHLHKVIPMGGGLGGGSSDGSYVLLGLNELFNLNLSNSELQQFAAKLGSDCPFFIENTAQIATGRGEILEPFPLDLKGYFLKIINLGIHVSTQEAYAGVTFCKGDINVKTILENDSIENYKSTLFNSFEYSIFTKHPILSELKNVLYDEGATYAAMTGSGSTLFAIYKEKPSDTEFNHPIQFEEIVEL